MEIKYIDIDRIKPNPDNPRTISADKFHKLVQSIKDFPEMLELRPIVVNADFVALGGNQRHKAAKAAGLTKVPYLDASELTPAQQKEFILKDNVGFGEWDFEALRVDYGDEQLEAWGLDLGMPEIVEEKPEAKEDYYKIPDRVPTDIETGDLFAIGPHRLICGDARDPGAWERLCEGRLIDLVVTDPPYNVGYEGHKLVRDKIANDDLDDVDFFDFLLAAFKPMAEHTKPGGAWYVWHADTEGLNFRNAFVAAGLMLKQVLIWAKHHFVISRQDYHWKHEPCLYGWKPGAGHYFTNDRTNTTVSEDVEDLKKLSKKELLNLVKELTADPESTTVLRADKPAASKDHPTMKPIKLIGPQIENSSRAGEVVADGFGGSGTTMVAAHQLRRVCYMIEQDPRNCQIIINRMRALDPDIEIEKL